MIEQIEQVALLIHRQPLPKEGHCPPQALRALLIDKTIETSNQVVGIIVP